MKSNWSTYADQDGNISVINYPRVLSDMAAYKNSIEEELERRKLVQEQIAWYRSKWLKLKAMIQRIFT